MGAWCEETLAVHRSGEPVATKLRRIAEKARKEPRFKFTSLYHLMNEELLRGVLSAAAEGCGCRHRQNDQGFVRRKSGNQSG